MPKEAEPDGAVAASGSDQALRRSLGYRADIASLRETIAAQLPVARVDDPELVAKRAEAKQKRLEEIAAAKALHAELEAKRRAEQPEKDARDAEYQERRRIIRRDKNRAATKLDYQRKKAEREQMQASPDLMGASDGAR